MKSKVYKVYKVCKVKADVSFRFFNLLVIIFVNNYFKEKNMAVSVKKSSWSGKGRGKKQINKTKPDKRILIKPVKTGNYSLDEIRSSVLEIKNSSIAEIERIKKILLERRAKMYYLRGLTGKVATKIKEKNSKVKREAMEDTSEYKQQLIDEADLLDFNDASLFSNLKVSTIKTVQKRSNIKNILDNKPQLQKSIQAKSKS